MTDADYALWLADPSALPTVIIEAVASVAGTDTTRYLATIGYTTGAADTPANTPYLSIASAGIRFTESLSLTADGSLSVGDIEIHNMDGSRDSWLNDIWTNRPVQAWVGDVRWPRADFRMIFNGVAAGIDSKSRQVLNLKLRDKLQRLNTPVTEHKLGGTTPNKDEIIPVCFGEVHNISPLLVDPTTLKYQVHDGAQEDIFEVRDNGVPVTVTKTNSAGTFTLSQSPAGAVTVSAQGDKPSTYANTISLLIQRLATGFGKASDRFVSGDLDAANLAAFNTAHAQPVGLYIGDRTNVLEACRQLASSIGAQIVMSRAGQLRLFQVDLPATGTVTDLTASMMKQNNIKIASRPDVKAAVKLGFCKNWSVQEGLQTTIPAQHKDLFATEWLTETATDVAVQAAYKLNTDPVQIDSLLLRRTDAAAEALRELNLWKVQRTVFEFEGLATCLNLELGAAVRLYHPRFGLAAGVLGMVISLAVDWQNRHVTVQVLV